MAQEEFLESLKIDDFISFLPSINKFQLGPEIGLIENAIGGGETKMIDEALIRELQDADFKTKKVQKVKKSKNTKNSHKHSEYSREKKKKKSINQSQINRPTRQSNNETGQHLYKPKKTVKFHKITNSFL